MVSRFIIKRSSNELHGIIITRKRSSDKVSGIIITRKRSSDKLSGIIITRKRSSNKLSGIIITRKRRRIKCYKIITAHSKIWSWIWNIWKKWWNKRSWWKIDLCGGPTGFNRWIITQKWISLWIISKRIITSIAR